MLCKHEVVGSIPSGSTKICFANFSGAIRIFCFCVSPPFGLRRLRAGSCIVLALSAIACLSAGILALPPIGCLSAGWFAPQAHDHAPPIVWRARAGQGEARCGRERKNLSFERVSVLR